MLQGPGTSTRHRMTCFTGTDGPSSTSTVRAADRCCPPAGTSILLLAQNLPNHLAQQPSPHPPFQESPAYLTRRQGTHLRSHPRTGFTKAAARHAPNLTTRPPSPTAHPGKPMWRIPLPGPQAGWDPSRRTKTHDVSLEMKFPSLMTQASTALCKRCRARDLLGGFPLQAGACLNPQNPAAGPAPPDKG